MKIDFHTVALIGAIRRLLSLASASAGIRCRTNKWYKCSGESVQRTYEQDKEFARRLRNASVEGASTMSSVKWFQSITVHMKKEYLYRSVRLGGT